MRPLQRGLIVEGERRCGETSIRCGILTPDYRYGNIGLQLLSVTKNSHYK